MWLIGGLAFYAFIIFQSSIDRYEPDTAKVWAWALPVIMPTMLLIVAVQAAEAVHAKRTNTQDAGPIVSRLFFWWTVILSLFYLGIVWSTALIPIFSGDNSLPLMQRSQLWLGPFQGLVAGAFGVFYVDSKNRG